MTRRVEDVDHVAFLVHDLDHALAAFVARLGLPVVPAETLPEVGVRVAYLDAGNLLLQLVQPTRPGPLWDRLQERGEGLDHLCFTVADIPTALADLAAGEPIPIVQGGRGRRACFLPAATHGLRIELTEREPWMAAREEDA